MKSIRILAVLLSIGLLAVGCSQEPEMTAPDSQTHLNYDKDGTETLGDPTIAIADGSGFVEGGVGMGESTDPLYGPPYILDFTVPTGASINQVLVYWSGATTGAPGDNTIELDGNEITGMLIGGATNFYNNYEFSAFRADITAEGWVTDGYNDFEITGFDFDWSNGSHEENNGVTVLVIYDDGSASELTLRDGLDLAFWDFEGPLEVTDPQTFTFAADPAERTADLLLFVGSVFIDRPNEIKVTTSGPDQVFTNYLNSTDGLTWDSMIIPVTVPAGDTSLTVELISTPTSDPLGASMSWVGAGLSLPMPPPLGCLGDFVWVDVDMDGIQDDGELGVEGVVVNLFDCEGNQLATDITDADGLYMFCELEAGQYMVQFMLPPDYEFSPQNQGGDPALDSDADPATGMTVCIDLGPGETDLTWDAGIFMPPLGCLGDFVWMDDNMDGIQDSGELGTEGVVVLLFDCEGNQLATTTTDADGFYMFCELEEGQYMVQFMLPLGYEFSPQNQGGDPALDSDADTGTGMTVCIDLGPGEIDLTWDAGIFVPEVPQIGCRMTGGGNDMFYFDDGSFNDYTFGGQAGAPLASPPQPWGNWTHTQKDGVAGDFTFHGGTPSAPEGTEIDWIECSDPGWCEQARQAPAKQLDFGGVGTFKNMRNAPPEIADHVIVGESLHWFEVNIDDLGEPGGHDLPDGCDPLGFGLNGGTELADCDCPDFYRIRIYEGMDDSSDIMYEVFGYIDGGNFQIHPPTGRDRRQLR